MCGQNTSGDKRPYDFISQDLQRSQYFTAKSMLNRRQHSKIQAFEVQLIILLFFGTSFRSKFFNVSCRKKLRYKEIKVLKSCNQSTVMSEKEKLIMTNTPLEQGEFKGKAVVCGLRSSQGELAKVLALMENVLYQRNKLQKATDNLIRKGNYGIKRETGVNYQILGISRVTQTKSEYMRHVDIQCPYCIRKKKMQ